VNKRRTGTPSESECNLLISRREVSSARALVAELFAGEARLMDALPTDDPRDEKRRRRVDLTRIEITA